MGAGDHATMQLLVGVVLQRADLAALESLLGVIAWQFPPGVAIPCHQQPHKPYLYIYGCDGEGFRLEWRGMGLFVGAVCGLRVICVWFGVRLQVLHHITPNAILALHTMTLCRRLYAHHPVQELHCSATNQTQARQAIPCYLYRTIPP